ncbi:hypothetical protein MSAN_02458300 [Mycena sanguinolenta]|uniref:Uncharacterized protein n=1 Tax=Mycena sanguinolenta TaxID=230812 RepID=A0A8H7CB96_9AGAR|nr:hypothetical protein MSAN_02458300 [Mycena sanguinolenta]
MFFLLFDFPGISPPNVSVDAAADTDRARDVVQVCSCGGVNGSDIDAASTGCASNGLTVYLASCDNSVPYKDSTNVLSNWKSLLPGTNTQIIGFVAFSLDTTLTCPHRVDILEIIKVNQVWCSVHCIVLGIRVIYVL